MSLNYFSKILALVVALILMVLTVPPVTVKAQGLVEYALILVVVGIGKGETAEVYLGQKSQPAETHGNIKVAFIYNVQRVDSHDPSRNGKCQETVQAPLETSPGLNILNMRLGPGNESLLVNGQPIPFPAGTCLQDAERVAIQIGRKVPPYMAERIAADPRAAHGLRLHEVWGYSNVDANGATVASVIREIVPEGFVQTFPGF